MAVNGLVRFHARLRVGFGVIDPAAVVLMRVMA